MSACGPEGMGGHLERCKEYLELATCKELDSLKAHDRRTGRAMQPNESRYLGRTPSFVRVAQLPVPYIEGKLFHGGVYRVDSSRRHVTWTSQSGSMPS